MTTATTQVTKPTDREVVITSLLNAPRALVFRAWTEPGLLARWWGPHGFTNPVCEVDLRPGGAYRIVMRSPEGVDYPVAGTYREIVEPERLVYTDSFEGLPEDWLAQLRQNLPDTESGPIPDIVVTATFEEQDGQTLLSVASRAESMALRDAILKMGAAEGWAESLEKLETVVSELE